jgi:hypothetical protein
MTQFEWTDKLTEAQIELLRQFYSSLPLVHIEQYPGWNDIGGNGAPVRYCIATENDKLKGYVAVNEFKKIEARIIFGPLATNADDSIGIILEVIRHYKAKGYLSLQVLLGMTVGTEATYLQYSLFKKHKFKCYFDKFNKGTLLLKLSDKSEEELLKYFSENHRRAIKKAITNNLTCQILQTTEEITEFANGFHQMYNRREIESSLAKSIKNFFSIYEWLQIEKMGFFMGVFEQQKMIGGVLIIFRGERAEYYCGFSLPDERKLPINHITFYEAMKSVKQRGISYFDFGGYNVFVNESDQVFHINKFKKGFHGEYFFYPPVMYFDLKPLGSRINRFLKKAKQKIAQIKK